jgi:hypothetical protein
VLLIFAAPTSFVVAVLRGVGVVFVLINRDALLLILFALRDAPFRFRCRPSPFGAAGVGELEPGDDDCSCATAAVPTINTSAGRSTLTK